MFEDFGTVKIIKMAYAILMLKCTVPNSEKGKSLKSYNIFLGSHCNLMTHLILIFKSDEVNMDRHNNIKLKLNRYDWPNNDIGQ